MRLVTPAPQHTQPAPDQIQDAIDDRNTDMARLAEDVKTCMERHGKGRTLTAVIEAWRLADKEDVKW